MNDLDQEIAIAKVCGWEHTKTVCNPLPSAYGKHSVHTADVAWDLPLPDYLSDLNAMHEAEKELPDPLFVKYANKIPPCATAAQRAEAFLKVLNLWEEQP